MERLGTVKVKTKNKSGDKNTQGIMSRGTNEVVPSKLSLCYLHTHTHTHTHTHIHTHTEVYIGGDINRYLLYSLYVTYTHTHTHTHTHTFTHTHIHTHL